MRIMSAALAGLLFGLGLFVSAMVNPAKILAFLDIAGAWDPSLAFVLVAAIPVAAIGVRLARVLPRPIFASAFSPPAQAQIDGKLLCGAALFGAGWGMVGYCPGPAMASLGFGAASTMIFVAAMFAGMIAARGLPRAQGKAGRHRLLADFD